eukprot:Nitzschia sp. Nitz4//scaffold102_size76354//12801//13427//NITZ4_005626-RA/size76354-processed-gene-0.110-mRNA-1//-1//CDS//3329532231//6194//frame0
MMNHTKACANLIRRGCSTHSQIRPAAFKLAASPIARPILACRLPTQAAFHSTPELQLPVRRRRKKTSNHGSDNNTDDTTDQESGGPNSLQHVAVTDDVGFVQGASALLDKLEAALAPMKPLNEFFVVERFFGDAGEVLTIDLGPKEGKYRIDMSLDEHMFEFSSPVSGKFLYILSAETGEWVGADDGHLFEGLLVRDLIRQCQGLPNL